MNDITQILDAVAKGNHKAASELFPLVYDELRKLASQQMMQENPGQTLQPTALVHEAFLRMVGPANAEGFANRRHFFAAAVEAMRRILVDHARRKARLKHGGGQHRVEMSDVAATTVDDRLLALDEALTLLASEDATIARVVEFRHFGGLHHEQIAVVMGITVYEARQKWTYARAWLQDKLRE